MTAQAELLDDTDTGLAAERLRGAVLSHRDWLAADQLRARLREQWRRLFDEFDVVLCPVTPTPAFPHDHDPAQWSRHIDVDGTPYPYPDQLVWAGVATAPGLPSTVVPIGQSGDGLADRRPTDRTDVRGPHPDPARRTARAEFRAFVPPPLD